MNGNILHILIPIIISLGQFYVWQNFRAGMALRKWYVYNLLLPKWGTGDQTFMSCQRTKRQQQNQVPNCPPIQMWPARKISHPSLSTLTHIDLSFLWNPSTFSVSATPLAVCHILFYSATKYLICSPNYKVPKGSSGFYIPLYSVA